MSEQAGHLYLDVEADLSGFGQQLQRKVDAATARVRAKIEARIDARTLQSQARLAADRVSDRVKINLQTKVDDRLLRAQVEKAVRMVENRVRITLPVKVDERVIRDSVQGALNDVTQRVTMRVHTEVDERGLRNHLRDTIADIEREAKIRVAMELDSRGLAQQARAVTTQIERDTGSKVRLPVEIDGGDVSSKVSKASSDASAAARSDPVTLPTTADTSDAEQQSKSWRRKEEGKPVNVRIQTPGLDRLLSASMAVTKVVGMMGLIAGIAAPIVDLVGALVQAVAGLYSLASSASVAAMALSAIPAVLAAIVQGAVVAVSAFRGIGDAVKALQKAEQQSGAAASANAARREAAAKRVASAQRSVANAVDAVRSAEENLARAAEDAAQRVADAQERLIDTRERAAESVMAAEQRLERSQASSLRAQEALTDARRDAGEALEDLRLRLSGAALDEEAAQLALERAIERQKRANANVNLTDLDRREADLAVRQAQQRLEEIQESNADLAVEAMEAQSAGVEGAANVIAAKERVVEAAEEEADAERDLAKAREDAAEDIADAEKDLARTRRDAARSVADAQKALLRAQQSLADSQSSLAEAIRDSNDALGGQDSAAQAAADAMDELSPAAQSFVRYLVGTFLPKLKNVRKSVQEALIPSVDYFVRSFEQSLPMIERVGVETAKVLGGSIRSWADTMSGPEFQKDLEEIGMANAAALGPFGEALNNLLTPMKDILYVLSVGDNSLLNRFAEWTERLTETWEETAKVNRENGTMEAFFDRAGDKAAQWGRIFGNILVGLYNIAKASSDTTDTVTDDLEDATERFRKWTEDNADLIKGYFQRALPTVRTFGRILEGIVSGLAQLGDSPTNNQSLVAIEQKLGPALQRLATAFQDTGAGEKFVTIITNLVDAITGLVESGAFGTFLTILEGVSVVLKDMAESESGQRAFAWLFGLAAILGPIGLVAGVLGKIATNLKRISKIPGVSKILGLTVGGAAAGGAAVAGKRGGGKHAKPKTVGKGLKGGGIALTAGTLLGGVAGSAIEDGKGGARDTIGAGVGGTATGAGVGAMVGTFIGPLGTAAGAAVGATAGWIITSWQNAWENEIKSWWDDMTEIHSERSEEMGGSTWDGFKTGLSMAWTSAKLYVKAWWQNTVVKPVKDMLGIKSPSTLFKEFGGDVVDGFINGLVNMPRRMWEKLVEVAEEIGRWFSELPGRLDSWWEKFKTRWSEKWDGIKTNARTKLDETATGIGNWFRELPGRLDMWWLNFKTRWSEKWEEAKTTVKTKFTEIKTNIGKFFTDLPGNLSTWFRSVKERWDQKWRELRDSGKLIMEDAKRKLDTVLSNIRTGFSTAVTNIGTAWDKLREAANKPVKFVVDTVYNNGIRKVWNKVAEAVGAREMPWLNSPTVPARATGGGGPMRAVATGGVLPGFTPGRDVHDFYSATAGGLSLSGGEAIMRPEWTKAVGPAVINAWNRIAATRGVAGVRAAVSAAMENGPGYYSGGIVRLGKKLQTLGYHVGQHPAFGRVGTHARGSLHYSGDAIDVNADGRGQAHENMMLDRLIALVRPTGFGMKWRSPGHWNHAHIDDGGSWKVGNERQSRRSGGGFWGGVKDFFVGNLSRAAGFVLNPITKSLRERFSKPPLTALMADAGKTMISKVLSWVTGKDRFDTGGIWQSGRVGVNMSGKPEVVFTNRQWALLSQVVASGVRNTIPDHAQGRAVGLGGNHPRVVIEDGAVRFVFPPGTPVPANPEAMERTLNEGLRRAAEFGIFDGGRN